MRRPRWRLLPLLLLTFIFFLATITAESINHDVGSNEQTALSREPTPLTKSTSHADPAGTDLLHDALDILRKIKSPTISTLSRYMRRPEGILGASIYYAKEAFVLLFMRSSTPSHPLDTPSAKTTAKLPQPMSDAVRKLQEAAEQGNGDAIYLLAELNFHGNYSYPVRYDEAFRRYEQLADLNGNSTAQFMLGFMYATGLNPAVPADQAKSMLYHTFAAEQGDTRSEMTLAYRSHAGIATAKDCEEAVHWYKKVADKAVQYYHSGPPGGHALVRDSYVLADEDGGVYGAGASVSSAGNNAKQGGPTSDAHAKIEDVMEFLHLQTSKGDLKAQFGMARLHYDGSRQVARDFRLAKKHFLAIARMHWSESGKVEKNVSNEVAKLATLSAGYLGRMFLRGEGMEQSFSRARIWFTRGVSNGDGLSQYSLGLMYMHGLGVAQDIEKAADYLSAAADQHLAVAQTLLGRLFLDADDTATAVEYFKLAALKNHIDAIYYLAEMHNNAIGMVRSCGHAAVYYKIVAEKAEPVWSSVLEANDAYEDGDMRKALIGYMMAAEQGSENAQANVAWLLDQSIPRWSPLKWFASLRQHLKPAFNDVRMALIYWARSGRQNNMDSLVKTGDYHLFGLGTYASPEDAAVCYQAAANSLQSAQAMWNMGWMYENGIGINQDFHIAKRLYDQALETNEEAYLPVKLSLWKLRWRSWWNRVTHGSVHGIEDDEDQRKKRSFAEWVQDFLEADAAANLEQYEADDWDAQHDAMPGGDGYYVDGDLDDGLLDMLLIAGLVAALSWLIYYRQQQQRLAEQRRRQGGAAGEQEPAGQAGGQPPRLPGQQPDGGFFPQPGDPNWNAWVAGGIGP